MSNVDLLSEVTERLNKYFASLTYAVKAQEVYLSSVVINDLGQQVVDYSQTVAWAIMEKVQDDAFPEYHPASAGLFTRQWTFDPAYRVEEKVLNIAELNMIGREVVESFRSR